MTAQADDDVRRGDLASNRAGAEAIDAISISTARLLIRTCRDAEAERLCAILHDARVHEAYYVKRANSAEPLEVRSFAHEPGDWTARGRLTLCAIHLGDNTVCGAVQISSGNLSYFVDPRSWRRGIGTEMVSAVCGKLLPALDRPFLDATVRRDNLGSIRILEHAGFVFSGLAQRTSPGAPVPTTLLRYRLRPMPRGERVQACC